ncbi:Predicted ABC-type ATPase [Lysobacter sp. yr284]|uniref:zeta toxin family protein n=1 Tax=Lysobacter sp. yr284 TaxID=1761791 RepID=UPI00089B4D02|nr:zeta toxin family protein [Lysobacter sp. yr284]SDY89602.1 Predicted ABC-type ATPase [Lysobacter sp. yr284]
MNASGRELDGTTHRLIFLEEIVPESGFNEATTQARPKAVFLAGQPGAGKGSLARAARTELKGDVVTVDPDELRGYHPWVKTFRNERPYTWADDTHSDASRWSKELRAATIDGRKNIVIDTTLGNRESAAELIKELQAKGYDVEIRAMAAHRLESELGVDSRFTGGFAKDGYGRYVPENVRAEVYEKLPDNLDHVRTETGVPVRIYSRSGAELYDSRTSPLTPGAAMEQAREARLQDPKVVRALNQDAKAQQVVHQELPDNLSRNAKVQPATAQALLHERSELKVVESVDRLAIETAKINHAVNVRPAFIRGVSTAGALGAAATAYDIADTTRDAIRLSGQGNQFGAESRIVGAVARNVSGLGGVALGSLAGAAVTSETGPGALVGGAIGGVVGAVAGDKVAEWIDQHRINNQEGNGHTWTFDPKQPERSWTRRELDLDAMRYSEGAPVYKPGAIKADPELADKLNYQASNRATELALSAPPRPQSPYEIPASAQDARSLRESPWERNPQTEQWTRQVAVGYIDKGVMSTRTDVATPQRAAELETQSQAIIAANATKTPAALATSYQTAFDQYGWTRHGEAPPAVKDAARHPGRLVASDGDTYERGNDGQWTSRGMVWDSKAEGNTRRELDATFERQQQTLKITTLAPVEVRPDPEPTKTATTTPPSLTPADAGHPERPLHDTVRGAVERFDQQLGKPWDVQSERMTASALAMAVEMKFGPKDDIRLAFNQPAPGLAAGEVVHVYRVGHPSPDPAAHHASMKTADAVSVPVEERYQQIETTRLAQAETAQRDQQQEHSRTQSAAGQGGQKMSV